MQTITKRTLLLPVGTNSLNELISVDLFKTGHLYVSYADDQQAEECFNQFLKAALAQPDVLVSLAFSRAGKKISDRLLQQVSNLCTPLFLPGDPASSVSQSRRSFLNALHKEFLYRKKNPASQSPLIVMIDDCLEFLSSVTKRSGEKLIALFTSGPEVDIHLVMASTWSFRKMSGQLLKTVSINCAEVVVSGEGFTYYKPDQTGEYFRLFPSRLMHEQADVIAQLAVGGPKAIKNTQDDKRGSSNFEMTAAPFSVLTPE